jgi:hypothetical protein
VIAVSAFAGDINKAAPTTEAISFNANVMQTPEIVERENLTLANTSPVD